MNTITYDQAVSEIRAECKRATTFQKKHPAAYDEWCAWKESEVPTGANEREVWWDNRRIEKRMRQIDKQESETRMKRLDAIKETDKRIQRLAQIERDEHYRRVDRLNQAVKSAKRQGCFNRDTSNYRQPVQASQADEELAALVYQRRNYWNRLGANDVATV